MLSHFCCLGFSPGGSSSLLRTSLRNGVTAAGHRLWSSPGTAIVSPVSPRRCSTGRMELLVTACPRPAPPRADEVLRDSGHLGAGGELFPMEVGAGLQRPPEGYVKGEINWLQSLLTMEELNLFTGGGNEASLGFWWEKTQKPSECWGATAWTEQGVPSCSGWGHACVLHPCSPVSRPWVAFFLTVGDLLPGDLVCVSPSFSTAWGIHRITEAGESPGVSAPSLTFWTSAPSLLQA